MASSAERATRRGDVAEDRDADGVRQLGHLLHPDVVPDPGLPMAELDTTIHAGGAG